MRKTLSSASCAALAALASLLFAPSVWACYTIGNGDCADGAPASGGSKWDLSTWGTGATITWSYMTDGVGVGSSSDSNTQAELSKYSGTNQLGTLRSSLGASAFDTAVNNALNSWASVANLHFVNVSDNGAVLGGSKPGIDLRIGAFAFVNDNNTGGVGYGPPGFDDQGLDYPLSSYVLLNTNNHFEIDPGVEGAPLQTGGGGLYLNDVQGLVLHEIGHILGLDHSTQTDAVMCGYQFRVPSFDPSTCDVTHVNRVLTTDDVQGAQLIYGPTAVPLPASAWLLLTGLAGMLVIGRRRWSAGAVSSQEVAAD